VRKNFAGWSNKEIAKVVGWLVKTVAMFTPAAMLGSTAPFPDPGEVVVEITSGQPVNAMGAFEKAGGTNPGGLCRSVQSSHAACLGDDRAPIEGIASFRLH
jgi:hypothetical protein